MTLIELYENYQACHQRVNVEVDKLRREGVTEDFESYLAERLPADTYPCDWVTKIVHPIASQIEQAGGFARVEVLGPMGIGARVSLHCYREEEDPIEKICSITFEPELNLRDESPLAMVDYSTNTGRYRKGSMGEMNGLNYAAVPVPPDTQGADWLALLK